MDWLFDNLQILFVIAAAVAYWLNTMRQAKEEAREDHRHDDAPVDVEDIFGPDFDFNNPPRQQAPPAPHSEVFLPPPVVTSPPPPAAVAPPPLPGQGNDTREQWQRREFPTASPMPQRPVSPHDSPAVKDAHADELARQKSLQDRIQSLRQNRDQRSGGAAATERKVKAKRASCTGIIEEAADPTSLDGIRKRLRSSREARRAVVMREILGTPVGMR